MPPPVQLSGDAAATAHAAAAARIAAHRARMAAATKAVALTPHDGAAGAVRFGDVVLVGRGGGGGGGGGTEEEGAPTTGGSPLLFLSADPLSGVSAGVWEWPEPAGTTVRQQQQQHHHHQASPPPRALPVAAAVPPPLSDASNNNPNQGTACTALRVLPAAKGQVLGDVLRYGDRFALAIEDPKSVFFAASAGAPISPAANKKNPPPSPGLFLLLTSRAPVAALCPSARAPGGGGFGGGGGGSSGASGGGAQAVAFVEWSSSPSPSSSSSPPPALLPPSDASWVALPTDPEQRVLREGEPVEAGVAVLLAHAPTRRPLFFPSEGGGGGVTARWAAAATRTRAGSPTKRAHGVDLGPPALPENVWRFVLGR